jgi:hypothetical protein
MSNDATCTDASQPSVTMAGKPNYSSWKQNNSLYVPRLVEWLSIDRCQHTIKDVKHDASF